ncbi:MAG TPA: SNF2-related protein [Flavisolibacter sp.]
MKYNPHPYQDHATEHLIKHPASGLFLDMGLGKTVSTLTAIDRLMFDLCEVSKVLVIAPKRVAEDTWTTEAQKWDHLRHLRISKILGTEVQRKEALKRKADIYVINRENVVWLIAHYGTAFPFDMVVIDELSSFKSAKAARFKALRQIRPKVKRVVGLTGTPAPNGLLDLWPQLYLLDMGERLGKTLTSYRDKYFKPGKRNGYIVYEHNLAKGDDILGEDVYQKEIYEKIGDICISMKSEDYLSLPERIDNHIDIRFASDTLKKYLQFEREQVMAFDDEEVSAVNAAALTNKLLQFANGAIYGEDRAWYEVHRDKLEALEEIIDASNGQPVLVFYSFIHDKERIQKYLKKYKPQELNNSDSIARWNDGKIELLLAHPASAGHGLNLQAGGNIIVWFGLNWSLELYQQANKRLHRQGQTNTVIVHHLVAKDTMDEDVVKSLANKAGGQEALMQAVKARVQKYSKIRA